MLEAGYVRQHGTIGRENRRDKDKVLDGNESRLVIDQTIKQSINQSRDDIIIRVYYFSSYYYNFTLIHENLLPLSDTGNDY